MTTVLGSRADVAPLDVKPAVPTVGPKPAELGKILKLGTGNDAPRAQIGLWTKESLESSGITKDVAQQWSNVYRWQMQNMPKNPSAQGRLDLFNHLTDVLDQK